MDKGGNKTPSSLGLGWWCAQRGGAAAAKTNCNLSKNCSAEDAVKHLPPSIILPIQG